MKMGSLLIVILSLGTLTEFLLFTNFSAIKEKTEHGFPVKTFSIILLLLAVFVVFRQTAEVITTVLKKRNPGPGEIALWIDDLAVLSPLIIAAGIALLKKKAFGYAAAPGLLLCYGFLSAGLIPFMLIQANLKNEALPVEDIIVIAAMALLCLLPGLGYLVKTRKLKKAIISKSIVFLLL